MTTRSEFTISLTLQSAEEGIQVIAFVEDKELKISIRTAPGATQTRWKEFTLNEALSPLRPAVKVATVSAIHSFLRNKISKEVIEWTMNGIWINEITDAANADLDNGTRVPRPLFSVIEGQFKDVPPRSITFDNLQKVTEWFVDGPVTLMMQNDQTALAKFSAPVLKPIVMGTVEGVVPLTQDELDNGVELKSGKRVLVKMTNFGISVIDLIRRCRVKNKYILLQGPPGTGKSMTIAAAVGDFEVISCNPSTTRENLVGTFVNIKGEWVWKRGPLLRCMEEGKVLFLDDVGMMDVEEQSTLFSVMDERRMLEVSENPEYNDGDPVYAADGFYVILAANPDIPGSTLAEPLLSRCSYDPEFTTDFDLVAKIMGPDHDELVTVAKSMETMRQEGQVGQSLQFRDMMLYLENYQDDGSRLAMAALINRIKGESDRSELTDLIHRVMGVSNVPTFRI